MAEGGYWRDESYQEYSLRLSNLYSHYSQVQCEQASIETCNVMNWLGYGPCIRKARTEGYRENDRLTTAGAFGLGRFVTTGSKAEGLTSVLESDIDVMVILSGVVCTEDGVNYSSLPKEITVFKICTDICYHGHCRLLLDRRKSMVNPFVSDALCEDCGGHAFLSSDLLVNSYYDAFAHFNISPNLLVPLERTGPSIPHLHGALRADYVLSLPCYCPSLLQKWAERRRHWPPPDVVEKVVTLGAFVTPVGFKGSEFKHLEWRIGFNTGENKLVNSLNNTQTYLYVILKMVVKDVLKPINKEFTSYTLKNIVFWLAEKNPQELFKEKSLLYWVHEGLSELREAILSEYQPYFMIPERNLMAACALGEEQKRKWVAAINEMMDEGPKIILRLPKVRQAIISHPEPLLWYSKERMKLELLYLRYMHRINTIISEGGYVDLSPEAIWDDTVRAILAHMREIVFKVQQRMCAEGNYLDYWLNDFIRILR